MPSAHDKLLALAEQLKVTIVHAMRRKEHVKWDNAYDVSMTGLIGFWSGYCAMVDCDVVLMLGTISPLSTVPSAARGRVHRAGRSARGEHRKGCAS
jgi:thiamine pyrophosphate-dependent acetolactate synthase large subunit-like protein